jgi:hypothetical protein
MAEKGRPKETPSVQLDKWTREFYEVPTKPELGWKMVWHYDKNKTSNGPYKTEISYPKDHKFEKVKPEKNKAYNKEPVVVVFKTSNRSNAQTKIKVFNNKNIDEVLTNPNNLPGIPENAIWLQVGVGEGFIESFKSSYQL